MTDLSFTPMESKRQTYTFAYLTIHSFGQQFTRQKILPRILASTPRVQSVLNFFLNGILILYVCFQIFALLYPCKGFIIYLPFVIQSCA
jgi:hypothetical protein